MVRSTISTARELFQTEEFGRCELIRGALVMMSPAGEHHGWITMELARQLANFVAENQLGRVYAAETGFQIASNPDTVRAPDVAFVSSGRVIEKPQAGYFQGTPDLAVEVLSPSDRAGDVLAKVNDWMNAGALEVWVVDPKHQTISMYCKQDTPGKGGVIVLGKSDILDSSEVLPGFALRVGDIFD